MTLQRRLTLFFVIIVILPLATAGFIVQRLVVREISNRAVSSLGPALDSTIAIYNDRVDVLDDRVRAAVMSPRLGRLLLAHNGSAVHKVLTRTLARGDGIDFISVLDGAPAPVASASRPGEFLKGFDPPPVDAVLHSSRQVGPGFVRTAPIPVVVAGKGKVGTVVGGFWLDKSLLGAAQEGTSALSLVVNGKIVASTEPLAGPVPTGISYSRPFDIPIGDGGSRARAQRIVPGVAVLSSTPSGPINDVSRRFLTSVIGLLALALIGITALAYLLARLITQPLADLARASDHFAKGRFEHRVRVRSRDEIGQVATAFNVMAAELNNTMKQLVESRNQLQLTLRQVGNTLRSTTDMDHMLDSILNLATNAVTADAGVLWMFSPARGVLQPAFTRHAEGVKLAGVARGEGFVGNVVASGTKHFLSADEPAPLAAGEPRWPAAIAVPLHGNERARGVLALYRKDADRPFSDEDLEMLEFLVTQAGVAVENIILHEEAQRLSLTDGLTGVWNRRYLQMQARQVIATAERFDRPFSLLLLDLDLFKEINDTYGHQRGDAVLVEFSRRVNGIVREVDTFVRYGGEEFVCMLSETDLVGAIATAEKILDVIRKSSFGDEGEEALPLTVSIGIATYPKHGKTFRDLVDAADGALYQAKQQGRDRVAAAGGPSPLALH